MTDATDEEEWKARFKRAMIEAVVQNGMAVGPMPSIYNWYDPDYVARRHAIDTVGIDYEATRIPEDSSWADFKGTFYEGDHISYGVDVHLVLNDGTTSTWRYTGSMGELLQEILRIEEIG